MVPEAWWADLATIGGLILLAAGVVLLIWALFKDRSRGRRRCAKCWYDMTGVPGLLCPECGKAARLERGLFKTRRHWRIAVVAALILGLGYAGMLAPEVHRRGWLAAVPTTVLVVVAAAERPTYAWRWGPSGGVTFVIPPGTNVPAAAFAPNALNPWVVAPRPIKERLCDEAWVRLRAPGTWGWQARWFGERVLREGGVNLDGEVRLPERWTVNTPIPALALSTKVLPLEFTAKVSGPHTSAGDGLVPPVSRTGLATLTVPIEIRFGQRVVARRRVNASLTIVDPELEPVLVRRGEAHDNDAVAAAINLQLARSPEGRLIVESQARRPKAEVISPSFGIAARMHIMDGDAIAGSTSWVSGWRTPVASAAVWIAWRPGYPDKFLSSPHRPRVVLDSDLPTIDEAYRLSPIMKSAECWAGRVEKELPFVPE